MTTPAYLGEFEHLLLLAVLRLGSDAYGVDIARELEARAGRSVSRGALYTSLDRLEDKGLVAFRYCSPEGELIDADNHNGSARNIAGIFNDEKTVLGLMPHPEDATDELLGGTDGRGLFDGMTQALGA